jgi:hypothetical protein
MKKNGERKSERENISCGAATPWRGGKTALA